MWEQKLCTREAATSKAKGLRRTRYRVAPISICLNEPTAAVFAGSTRGSGAWYVWQVVHSLAFIATPLGRWQLVQLSFVGISTSDVRRLDSALLWQSRQLATVACVA